MKWSQQLDKKQITYSFNHAASTYDEVAGLQQNIGSQLVKTMNAFDTEPHIILDLGSGTGFVTQLIARQFPHAKIIVLDIAKSMLNTARQHHGNRNYYVCGDAELLSLVDQSVDLVISNLTFQWCIDLKNTLTECHRILKPSGRLLFSTFGPDTLIELRSSWKSIDNKQHVNHFPRAKDIMECLTMTGFQKTELDSQPINLGYSTVYELMNHLKKLGAHNVNRNRQRGLTGKNKIKQLVKNYEQYRDENQLLPARYEVIYASGTKK